MLQGKVKSALRLLSQPGRGRVLSLDDIVDDDGVTVRDVLKRKHPDAAAISDDVLLQDDPPEAHAVIFERLDGSAIRNAALRCQGAAGPSGLDAANWHRMCTMYHGESKRLCSAVAGIARRLGTTFVDPSCLRTFIACRLIPFSKDPGVRPIGICETQRRIIGKAIMQIVGLEVQAVAGSDQLCARQKSGCEAAVHAMRRLYEGDAEGILLVDASNAFNALNRRVMLHNIRVLCPSFATSVVNFYRRSAELFVSGDTLFSHEGTTQGDPLSMAIYAIATLPLITTTGKVGVKQTWFADDAGAGGEPGQLFAWWSTLRQEGPKYGYFVNPPKSWLVVKEESLAAARSIFEGTGIQITTDGRPLLGAPVGTDNYSASYVESLVTDWVQEIHTLSAIGKIHPHAAYAAYTHGQASKWSYLSRAFPGAETHFARLETAIRTDFLPALCKRSAGDIERDLIGLPARYGGLGVPDPTLNAAAAYEAASNITRPLVEHILRGRGDSTAIEEVFCEQRNAIKLARQTLHQSLQAQAASVKDRLSSKGQRAMSWAQERGASTWLTALPLNGHGFALSKGDFHDALCLRYGWEPQRLPSECSCGQTFTVEHALNCPCGGYISLRHNEVRDLLAAMLSETCHNVSTEPILQPLSGERFQTASATTTDEARLDIKAGGFWGGNRHECAFFDVRVFNPHARSYRGLSPANTYRQHERQKRRTYEERVREIEYGTFTPLVFSALGSAGPAATVFLKRLGAMIADKQDLSYAQAMGWLRCRLSFALLRSAILCIRGTRPRRPGPSESAAEAIDVAIAEARLNSEDC